MGREESGNYSEGSHTKSSWANPPLAERLPRSSFPEYGKLCRYPFIAE